MDHVIPGFNIEPVLKPQADQQYEKVEKKIWGHCNGGNVFTNEVGTLDGYGDVWLRQERIADIIYLSRVLERYPITLQGGRFTISMWDGIQKFQEKENGLLILDVQ